MKTSALIIILTSFLLSACGGGSNSNSTDTPPTGDNADSETQSANGIWEAETTSNEGLDTQYFGIFNEGKFALASFTSIEFLDTEITSGNIVAGDYSIMDDLLETDSAKIYSLNDDDFVEDTSGTAIVNSAATMMFTWGNGPETQSTNISYDDMNTLEFSIAELEGTWEISGSTCFGSVDDTNGCLLSITNTGEVSLINPDCELAGTISETTTNNVLDLAISITGDSCASVGEYVGFTAYGLDIDDDEYESEEIIMLMTNDQLGFGYNMQKFVTP